MSVYYVVTGASMYGAVWFGVYGSVLINEDLHNGFTKHLIMANRVKIYLFSSVFLSFIMALSVSVVMFLGFGLPLKLVLIPATLFASGVPFLSGYIFTFIMKMTNADFVEIQNVIFALLSFGANTLIPVSSFILFLNPIYDAVTLLRF